MAAKRFKSKVDSWIKVLMGAVIVVQILAIGSAVFQAGDPRATTAMILIGVAVVGLMIWLTLATYYIVDRGTLKIVAGPFRWKVRIDEISAVEATRSPLSSPALSLDRLRIRYGKNRRIMVSPADKAAFLKAIGHGVFPDE
jgi:hypothetical protein